MTIHASVATEQGTSSRTFSFSTDDLKHGPIPIPAFHAYITEVRNSSAKSTQRTRIRQMIPLEPEQTYERATREIPALDPWKRRTGHGTIFPGRGLSWQKFASSTEENVFIGTPVQGQGKELARLQWEGDRIFWKIGTGETPYYRDDCWCSVSES